MRTKCRIESRTECERVVKRRIITEAAYVPYRAACYLLNHSSPARTQDQHLRRPRPIQTSSSAEPGPAAVPWDAQASRPPYRSGPQPPRMHPSRYSRSRCPKTTRATGCQAASAPSRTQDSTSRTTRRSPQAPAPATRVQPRAACVAHPCFRVSSTQSWSWTLNYQRWQLRAQRMPALA